MNIQTEIFELLAICTSTRAYVNKLNACTCNKGKGITRKGRRFCDFCQALSGFKSIRQRLEKIKGHFKMCQL